MYASTECLGENENGQETEQAKNGPPAAATRQEARGVDGVSSDAGDQGEAGESGKG